MISLKKYGIDFEGPIENAIKISKTLIPERKTIRDGVIEVDDLVLVSTADKSREGRYGRVEEWLSSDGTIMYEKISKHEDGNLLVEACLQIAARNCLRIIGHESSIAEVKKILRWNKRITFMMEPFTGVLYLQTALHHLHGEVKMRGKTFDFWFLQIFAHLCLLLGYLEENLQINHRDLKGDNILISIQPSSTTHTIPYCGFQWTINVEHEIKLVDFGLACNGIAMNRGSVVSAGTVYEITDWCPKRGRDIYLLLCYFYAQRTFREMISAGLLAVIEDWLEGRVKEFLLRHGLERLSWIAFLVNNKKFDCGKCCPVQILNWISSSYPTILKKYVSI
jgi:serine/threonine protein kinase